MLETVWSVIPFIISMTIFLGGRMSITTSTASRRSGDGSLCRRQAVDVEAAAQYGQREINELHVPVGRKVKLTMTTEDVLHDFSIPAFRTKTDVVPRPVYVYLVRSDQARQVSLVLRRILRSKSLRNGRLGLRHGTARLR
jgi:heme/copper-type cytochrome/quinol oxidase subunit 2